MESGAEINNELTADALLGVSIITASLIVLAIDALIKAYRDEE